MGERSLSPLQSLSSAPTVPPLLFIFWLASKHNSASGCCTCQAGVRFGCARHILICLRRARSLYYFQHIVPSQHAHVGTRRTQAAKTGGDQSGSSHSVVCHDVGSSIAVHSFVSFVVVWCVKCKTTGEKCSSVFHKGQKKEIFKTFSFKIPLRNVPKCWNQLINHNKWLMTLSAYY